MDKRVKEPRTRHEPAPVSLSELIHQQVRVAIEMAVHEELRAVLGATPTSAATVDVATATAPSPAR
jgi:hypothetical protein